MQNLPSSLKDYEFERILAFAQPKRINQMFKINTAIAAVTIALAGTLTIHASDSHHATPESLAPSKAFELIQEGNKRYVEGKATHPHQDAVRRVELAKGQNPHTIVLSCADSRTTPEIVMDQGQGDLFDVRVAGNVLGAASVASIEYAVEHLGTRFIVIMGHTSCGAVKAALSVAETESAGSPDLDTLLSGIRPNLKGAGRSIAAVDPTVKEPVKNHISAVKMQLLSRSKIIRKAVESGKVSVVPAIYNLDTGKVEYWDKDGLK